jgi:ferredoxin--NADP+ reductase
METITDQLPNDPLIGDLVREKLTYYPTVTREPFRHNGRITALIRSGQLFEDIGLPSLDRENDRVMLCGSPHMLSDLQTVLAERSFNEGNHSTPGHFVIEKAFAEK